MADVAQEDAWSRGATRVPEGIIADICEATNDGRPTGWPKFYDRTGEQWQATGERHDGDVVMMPGSDWAPMLRRDVQAWWGPLTTEGLHDEWSAAVNWHYARAHLARDLEASDG